ncbi:hypothetical protein PR048_026261 [Dryococelus australis]|uniref:Uncharacterized protein n=1 Tax=Dryococelus australis TaxID=614101 RepID=A0ABQ9GKW8_9NEOP|nr:hypothetical protein PR048_026261 [Dryococelus australis]
MLTSGCPMPDSASQRYETKMLYAEWINMESSPGSHFRSDARPQGQFPGLHTLDQSLKTISKVPPQDLAFALRLASNEGKMPNIFNTLLLLNWGRGGSEVRLLAFHLGEPGSIPGRFTLDFRKWESCRTIPLVGGFFSGISRFSRPFAPALLHSHLASPSSALKTTLSGAAQIDISVFLALQVATYGVSGSIKYKYTTQWRVVDFCKQEFGTPSSNQHEVYDLLASQAAWPMGSPSQHAAANQTQDQFPEPLTGDRQTGTLTSKEVARHSASVRLPDL